MGCTLLAGDEIVSIKQTIALILLSISVGSFLLLGG